MEALESEFKTLALTTGDTTRALARFPSPQLLDTDVPRHTAFARRPDDGGKAGRPIALLANLYKIKIPSISIYHFDVAINLVRSRPTPPPSQTARPGGPPPLGRILCRAVWSQLVKDTSIDPAVRSCAYDGAKSAYFASNPAFAADIDGKTYTVTLAPESTTREGRQFTVKFSASQALTIDLSVLDDFVRRTVQGAAAADQVAIALQALNVLFTTRPCSQARRNHRRSRSQVLQCDGRQTSRIGCGVVERRLPVGSSDAWRGLRQSRHGLVTLHRSWTIARGRQRHRGTRRLSCDGRRFARRTWRSRRSSRW